MNKKDSFLNEILEGEFICNCIIKTPLKFPLSSVLKNLIRATEILLKGKNYDGDGWETLYYNLEAAKRIKIEMSVKND